MNRESLSLLMAGAVLFAPVCPAQEYPTIRVPRAQIGLEGNWKESEDVLFGIVTNIRQVAVQQVENLPWPISPSIHEIYWCEADFQATAAVKGNLPAPGKSVLWAVIRPACAFNMPDSSSDARQAAVTRVWFFREEGQYLRPVSDCGVFSVSFNWKWVDVPKSDVARLFALLLLDPTNRGLRPEQYAEGLIVASEVVRSILPREELVARLKALSLLPAPRVREDVCGYLAAEFQERCDSK